ncbi:O-antigen ligase [Polaribacter sp. Q13]|uniref:O-antigen ligase family protein n=1 Tax=Polaribacter sp. Q13 TaxID=2806551 RepID=UPI00193B618D|nr:O-antigen ligase family protein [Polaribacter sp. Q13]QVY64752.1 O-antigen ligase family protein [Polaribacter sp. Q13]
MKINKTNHLVLTIILCLNAIIILFPSNFKFIPVLALLLFSCYYFFKNKNKGSVFFVFASIPYLLLILGMLFTDNISNGFKSLETGSSLLIYPLCFALLPKNIIRWQIDNRLNYILGSFCFATFIFTSFVFLYFKIFEERSLTYIIQHNNILTNLSIHPKYRIHPIYLALNVGLSLIFSFFIVKKIKNIILKIITFVFIVYTVLLIAIINKRMAIIALLMVGLIYIIVELKKIKKKKLTLVYYVVIFTAIVLGVVFLPRYKNQNSFHEFNHIVSTINNPETSIGKRVFLYKSVFNLFIKNPLLGVGTGDANIILSDDLANQLQKETEIYNSHNQYLSYLISLGLFGFVIFISYIIYIFKIALIKNDILLLCIFVFLCLNMMSENILERESGVLVYAFFINFLLRANWNLKNKLIK